MGLEVSDCLCHNQTFKIPKHTEIQWFLEERGRHSLGLTPEKLQDSGLLSSSRLPSSGPSPVVKLPRELLPFFRMSGSLGSSHSMVGPAMDGEVQSCSRYNPLPSLPDPPRLSQLHRRTPTLNFHLPKQHLSTTWLLAGQTATPQPAAVDQKSVTQLLRPAEYQDTAGSVPVLRLARRSRVGAGFFFFFFYVCLKRWAELI